MFEKLKAKFLDGRRILNVEEIKLQDGTLHEQSGVTFADAPNEKPQVVHKDELTYLTFDNEKDSIEKRTLAFSTATASVQQKIMDDIRWFNPKLKELQMITNNIGDTFNSILNRFHRSIFGGETGEYDKFTLSLRTILSTISATGKEVDYSMFKEAGLAIFKTLIEQDIGFEASKQLIPALNAPLQGLFVQACEAIVKIPGKELRLRDIIDFVETYEATHGIPKELQDAEVREVAPVETAPSEVTPVEAPVPQTEPATPAPEASAQA